MNMQARLSGDTCGALAGDIRAARTAIVRQQAREWRMPEIVRKVQIARALTMHGMVKVSVCDVTVARVKWAELSLPKIDCAAPLS